MEISISKQQLIALFGAILLLLGSFLPVVSAPIVGSMSLFSSGKSDGLIIVVLAVVAMILAVLNKIKEIRIVAIISIGVVLFDFYQAYSKISNLKKEMTEKLADNPFGGMASAMMDSVQLQYGWVVLLLGGVILLFGSLVKIVEPGVVTGNSSIETLTRSPITEGKAPPIVESKINKHVCRYCNANLPANSLKCDECGSIN